MAEGYFRARGREGMGLGDVKMMAMAGAFLGLQRALADDLAGVAAGQPHRRGGDCAWRKGPRLRTAFRNFSGCGRDAGGFLRFADPGVVPFASCGALEGMLDVVSTHARLS